jgi:hypothetical protein
MDDRRIVVLFGDSLLLDTVEASLSECQELGVMRIHTSVPNIGDRLASLRPDLVIFDWDAPHCQFVLPLLRTQPGIPLLGLDITCSQAIALGSRQYAVQTAEILADLIKQQTSGQPLPNERSRELIY